MNRTIGFEIHPMAIVAGALMSAKIDPDRFFKLLQLTAAKGASETMTSLPPKT